MAEYAVAEFDDEQIRNFVTKLQKKVESAKNGAKIFQDILNATVIQDVTKHFKDQQGEEGPWKPWSENYAKFMARIGKSGNNILQDTGRLRQGITPGRAGSEFVEWVNQVNYAATHNYGDETRNIPERDFMWLSEEAMEAVSEKTIAFLLSDDA